MTDEWTDRQRDIQRETIIACHYHMVGYKKYKEVLLDEDNTVVCQLNAFVPDQYN